jgi:hypothetical protein
MRARQVVQSRPEELGDLGAASRNPVIVSSPTNIDNGVTNASAAAGERTLSKPSSKAGSAQTARKKMCCRFPS